MSIILVSEPLRRRSVQVGAVSVQQLDELDIPLATGDVKRGLTVAVGQIDDRRIAGTEHFRARCMSTVACNLQRRATKGATCIEEHVLLLNQILDHVEMSSSTGGMEHVFELLELRYRWSIYAIRALVPYHRLERLARELGKRPHFFDTTQVTLPSRFEERGVGIWSL